MEICLKQKRCIQFAMLTNDPLRLLAAEISRPGIFGTRYLGNWFMEPALISCPACPVPQLDCQK